MIKKLIPVALPVLALVGGAFAGDMLRSPAAKDAEVAKAEATEGHDTAPATEADVGHNAAPADNHGGGDHASGEMAFFTFPTQFFVPLVRQGDLRDMMILTLTLQTDSASQEALRKKEHALRDALLRQLLIHANTGGFDGNFTADRNLLVLRDDLLKAAQATTDLPLSAVLIEDIAKQ
nr:flagellar basal body-associated FliL family protein [Paracoccus saliphilus]